MRKLVTARSLINGDGQMTYGDILIEAMAEATGESKEGLRFLLDVFKKQYPDSNIDQELSDEEASALLERIRNDKDSISTLFTTGELPGCDHKDKQ